MGSLAPPPITPAQLLRHDRPAPRYTSYPTAASFHSGVGAEEYESRLRTVAERRSEPLTLYVHLPFCDTKCTFCGCTMVVTRDAEKMDLYTRHLESEIVAVSSLLGERRGVTQLHLGGGTPNHLPKDQIERLMRLVRDRFELAVDAEISLEVDPRVGSADQVDRLRELGFNRVSFGVQDFDPGVQRAINRRQEASAGVECFEAARAAGFGGINIDLVFGLPGQTRAGFGRTVERLIDLRPDRIAVFSFAYVPWLRPHQKAITPESLPRAIEKLTLYCDARERLIAGGYVQIGMDHFALPDDELARALAAGRLRRNFQGYTVVPGSDCIGLGMSGIGDLGGAYVQNDADLKGYSSRIEAGRLATYRGYLRDEEDDLRKEIIHGMLCCFGLEYSKIESRWGIDFAKRFPAELRELERLADDGLIQLDSAGFRATELGKLLIRIVAMPFDAHIDAVRARQENTFSQSV